MNEGGRRGRKAPGRSPLVHISGEGIPVAIEVVEGNAGDPETIPAQVAKLKERFGLARVVVVGARGMVTSTQIEGAIHPGGFGWISALKHGAMEKLALEKVIQPSLFDESREEIIAREAATDGIYGIRTSEPKAAVTAAKAVSTYKELAKVERAFRCLKGVDLQVRPIHHRLAARVKAHLLLCLLAYDVE